MPQAVAPQHAGYQQPAYPTAAHQPPVHPHAVPVAAPYAVASAAGRPRASRTAVAALVVACVALTGVVGVTLAAVVPFLLMGAAFAGGVDGGMFPESEYELLGTLPAAEVSQDYPDDLLVAEVERTLEGDWSTYSGIECEPLGAFEEGASTTCTGTVDGMDEELDVVVEDELGHFTLTYFW